MVWDTCSGCLCAQFCRSRFWNLSCWVWSYCGLVLKPVFLAWDSFPYSCKALASINSYSWMLSVVWLLKLRSLSFFCPIPRIGGWWRCMAEPLGWGKNIPCSGMWSDQGCRRENQIQTLGKVVVKREKWARYPQFEEPQIPSREN